MTSGPHQQISPASTIMSNPLFKSQIKAETLPKSVDSLGNIGGMTTAQQQLGGGLQWPYNIVPGMLNNNFYSNVGM
jgi:hypothetical protein